MTLERLDDEVVWLDAEFDPRPPLRDADDLASEGRRPRRPRRRFLVVAGLGLVLGAGAGVVTADGGIDRTVERVTGPEVPVTLVSEERVERDTRLGEQGRRWSGTFAEVLGTLPLVATEPGSPDPTVIVDAGTGKRAGVLWQDEVQLGPDGAWQLAVEAMRRAPATYADPCRPERWGMVGAEVLSCEVAGGGDTSRVRSVSSLGGADPDASGWTQVSDVRDGVEHTQVRLTRLASGSGPAPLDLDELERIALDPAWHPGDDVTSWPIP